MHENYFTKGLFAALLLTSPLAGAGPYPPEFQPKILYQDAEAIAKSTAAAAPAEPAKPSAAASKYPEFEPTVLYRNAELIAKHAEAKVSTEAAGAVTPSVSGAGEEAKAASPLMENLPIALVVFGLIGLAFWSSRRSAAKAQEVQRAAPSVAAAPGQTGVARYLKSVGLPAGATGAETGVARYLKSLPAAAKAAETGVARYLKGIGAATGTTTAETGVARYLKNRT